MGTLATACKIAVTLLASVPAVAAVQPEVARPEALWIADELQCPLDPEHPWGNTGSEPFGPVIPGDLEPPTSVFRPQPVIDDPQAIDPESVPVILQVVVNRNGHVERIDRIRGSGPALSASVAAVRRWRFKPATLDGEPVCVVHVFVPLEAAPTADDDAEPQPEADRSRAGERREPPGGRP